MSIFYTRKGDMGKSEVGKKKVLKCSCNVAALGSLDEVNSMLGLIRSFDMDADLKATLRDIQEDFFVIQAEIAELIFGKNGNSIKLEAIKILWLENLIDSFAKDIGDIKGFVVTGENSVSAWLDYARTVVRRAERDMVKLKKVSPTVLAYLNRLSSLLFVMARLVAKKSNIKEKNPKYK